MRGGIGFCRTENPNNNYIFTSDTSLYPVNILHDEFCLKHLKKNLAVELPEVSIMPLIE